jgi:hypothetical protein
MLRQVHIFHSQKIVFSEIILSVQEDELNNIIKLIGSYIANPVPDRTHHSSVSNYQIFHQGLGNIYFLLITDKIDNTDYFDEEIKKIIQKFRDLFPNPEEIIETSLSKYEFREYLYEIQKSSLIKPVKLEKDDLLTGTMEKEDELFSLLNESQKKLDDLKGIKETQVILESKKEEKKKSSVTGPIQFTKKIMVKELPNKEKLSPKSPMSYFPKESPKSSDQIKTPQTNSVPKLKKLTLKPQDIKLNILSNVERKSEIDKSVKPPKIQINKIDVENKLDSIKIPDRLKDISNEVKNLMGSREKVSSSAELNYSSELQKLIQKRGSFLNSDLCVQFINEIHKSLGETLTLDDIKIAANYFCDIEQNL